MICLAAFLMTGTTANVYLQTSVGLHILRHSKVKVQVLNARAEDEANRKLGRASRHFICMAFFVITLTAAGMFLTFWIGFRVSCSRSKTGCT
jgi:hypothetical protein